MSRDDSGAPDEAGIERLLGALGTQRARTNDLTARLVASLVVTLDGPAIAEYDRLARGRRGDSGALVEAEAAWVRAVARRLPQPYRDVVHWRYGLDGRALTIPEVALSLNCGVTTARGIEQAGLRLLRDAMPLASEAAALRQRLAPHQRGS